MKSFALLGLIVFSSCYTKETKTTNEETIVEIGHKTPEQFLTKVKKTDAEWMAILTPEQYRILRKSGTEKPNGEIYQKFNAQKSGTYHCIGCGTKLFSSKEKFDSHCGWPSFFGSSYEESLQTVKDLSAGMMRVEARCAKCDGHLGHVFEGEGFKTPTDKRYCINGSILKFIPDSPDKKSLP